MRVTILASLLLITALQWCCTNMIENDVPAEIAGMVPVYSKDNAIKAITADAPRPTVKAGKVYTYGTTLLQVEQDSGIHLIDYSDPRQPRKTGFIRSFLCKELSMKDGHIYTNNLSDLVVIDIRNPNAIKETGRVADVFPDLALQYPPNTDPDKRTYFECPDLSKGYIIRWEQKIIKNPKCWR